MKSKMILFRDLLMMANAARYVKDKEKRDPINPVNLKLKTLRRPLPEVRKSTVFNP
jgi:hypothetical protein